MKMPYAFRFDPALMERVLRLARQTGANRTDVAAAALDVGLHHLEHMLRLMSVPMSPTTLGLMSSYWRHTVGSVTLDELFRSVLTAQSVSQSTNQQVENDSTNEGTAAVSKEEEGTDEVGREVGSQDGGQGIRPANNDSD
jgi:predicted transcriptional regulator